MKRIVLVVILVALAPLALFTAVSYPMGRAEAHKDEVLCEPLPRRWARPGMDPVESREACIRHRQEQRWGPWKAWKLPNDD